MEIKTIEPLKTLSIRVTVKPDAIGSAMHQILPELLQYASAQGLQMTGPPYTRYHRYSDTVVDMESGIPVADPGTGNDRILAGELPGGKVVSAVHTGSYNNLHETYQAAEEWIAEQKLHGAGAPWEIYVTNPQETPEAEWKTEIFMPIK